MPLLTRPPVPPVGDSVTDLLVRARRQDREAVAELHGRHRAAARRLAATDAQPGDPDDLADEAFSRIISALGRGAGPSDAFRAYLFAYVRDGLGRRDQAGTRAKGGDRQDDGFSVPPLSRSWPCSVPFGGPPPWGSAEG